MNKWIKKSLLVLSLGSMMAMPLAAESLDLSEGTMSTGGMLGLNMGGEMSPKTWNYTLAGDISLDYFIIDNLSLNLLLGGQYTFGDATDANPLANLNGFNFGLGMNYYFDMGSNISPYLAVAATVGKIPDGWYAKVPVSVGLLAAMNSSVALVFGVKADFTIPFGGNGTRFNMGVGYAGVKAFF